MFSAVKLKARTEFPNVLKQMYGEDTKNIAIPISQGTNASVGCRSTLVHVRETETRGFITAQYQFACWIEEVAKLMNGYMYVAIRQVSLG